MFGSTLLVIVFVLFEVPNFLKNGINLVGIICMGLFYLYWWFLYKANFISF